MLAHNDIGGDHPEQSPGRYLDELFRPPGDGDSTTASLTPSWGDVLELISSAEAQYESNGDKNRLRRVVRKGQDAAVVLNGLVEMIPDEYGLGILRVALSKIFMVRPPPSYSNPTCHAQKDTFDMLKPDPPAGME